MWLATPKSEPPSQLEQKSYCLDVYRDFLNGQHIENGPPITSYVSWGLRNTTYNTLEIHALARLQCVAMYETSTKKASQGGQGMPRV